MASRAPAKSTLDLMAPPVGDWFRRALGTPTRAQDLGWPAIARGESTLLLAPTGSGKTLAAFLVALDRLMFPKSPRSPKDEGVRLLYVSPLKALAFDVDKNLRAPLAGIAHAAQVAGLPMHVPTLGIRTGDTPAKERVRMLRHPPDILITTPESLYLLLSTRARATLASVDTVIIDEIHAISGTKRGAHLMLSIERLEALRQAPKGAGKRSRAPLQRIGLSATQRPLDVVARALGGFEGKTPRPITVVDASHKKAVVVRVESAGLDAAAEPTEASSDAELLPLPVPRGGERGATWPKIHTELLKLIEEHRSTMIFVNSRRLAERLASALNERAGRELALAHHGSIAREKRVDIEDRLKRGELPAIVATSSLELGIDMGAVDLVVQIEAPPSIASGLQRIGRAGHSVGATSTGILIPKHRADLLSCAAAVVLMDRLEVEATVIPRSPLDVLAQQLVAIVGTEARAMPVDELFQWVKRAASFHELSRRSFEGVLDMLSGRYPSERFAGLKARLVWDRIRGTVRAREGALKLAIASGGTIPDRGLYGVYLKGDEARGGKRVGELDEEMVFELREGEVFLLGASSWRADEIGLDRVIVSPAPGEPGKMPFWHGDRPGRARAFGDAIGRMTREIAAEKPKAAEKSLMASAGLSARAAHELVQYVGEQKLATGEVPSDRTVLVERWIDEMGDHRVTVMTPLGAKVHAPWATAILPRLRTMHGGEADAIWTDDGMSFRLSATDKAPDTSLFFPAADDIERLVVDAIPGSAVFAARFREAAARALLLPRRQPGKRTPLWAQRRRASDLLAVASEYPSFPILLEAYRECLREVFDLTSLEELLRGIEARAIRIVTVDTQKPSPFAASVMFSFLATVIYEGDTPLAERRAQALSIDHAELAELLGEAELRKLLDPDVVADHERALQRLDHKVTTADGLVDLVRFLGALSREELKERAALSEGAANGAAVDAALLALEGERQLFRLTLQTEERFAASEDAARYRDALGVVPPRGLPRSLLGETKHAFRELVALYARTHGPFRARDVAARYGVGEAVVATALRELVTMGRILEGAFSPNAAAGLEHCDRDVLTVLRRKSLAKLRKQIEPADGAAFARFLGKWHGLGERRRTPESVLAVVEQLEGCPLPASALERDIFPARIVGYESWDLDALMAMGEITWRGLETLGAGDGRIALFLTDHEAALGRPNPCELTALAAKVQGVLGRRGALFFHELSRELPGYPGELADALWELVWAGLVRADTLAPLRSRLALGAAKVARRSTARSGPPGTEGRWSLVEPTVADAGAAPTETEKRLALARSLLDRYGILTSGAAHAEGLEGGFGAVYEVLRTMEQSGRVRRGYFVAGLGGAQFAAPGADDRLRAPSGDDEGRPTTVVLSAVDPANPYGSILPWPGATSGDEGRGRPSRVSGAKVVLAGGRLVGFVGRSLETCVTFLPDDEPMHSQCAAALAEGLARVQRGGERRAILLSSIDGAPAKGSPLAPALIAAGFQQVGDGFVLRRRYVDGGEADV